MERIHMTPSHIQAKFQREVNRIGKSQDHIEQKYRVSERKTTSTQRAIISLLGNDVYLDPGIHASVLYGQNIPGFCYRRNGDARRPCSIYESKTTRVIHTLEAQFRDEILEDPASNVVSDNPQLDEILSSPQVLPILCDLRTTALLGRNPQLLLQFVEGLRAEDDPLRRLLFPQTQDPMTSLRRYRAVLIQDLFDSIRILVELRLNSALVRDNPPPLPANPPGNSGSLNQIQRQPNQETWNEVLLNKLQVLAAEEKWEQGGPEVDNQENPKPSEPLDQENWNMEFSSVLDFEDSGKCVSSTANPNVCSRKVPNPAEDGAKALAAALAGLKVQRRAAFESTIRELLGEVKDVVELGKMIREVRRKNPCRAHCSTGVLEKLLKEEVFTSLNAEYCTALQEQGKLGAGELEQCLISKTAPEPPEGSRIGGTQSSNSEQDLDKLNSSTRTLIGSSKSKIQGQLKTTSRLCCPACKAKLRQGYEKFKERDENYRKQLARVGTEPNGRLMREIERISEEIDEIHPLDTLNLFNTSASSSAEPLRTIHMHDSPLAELDENSFSGFPLSLSLTAIPTVKLSPPSPPAPVNFFPDLSTPLSYAPSPIPFTAPVSSPGRTPILPTKRSSLQHRRKFAGHKATSWTLKVSRFDLFKLRHELQRVAMEDRMLQLTHHLSMQNAEEGKTNRPHLTNPVAF